MCTYKSTQQIITLHLRVDLRRSDVWSIFFLAVISSGSSCAKFHLVHRRAAGLTPTQEFFSIKKKDYNLLLTCNKVKWSNDQMGSITAYHARGLANPGFDWRGMQVRFGFNSLGVGEMSISWHVVGEWSTTCTSIRIDLYLSNDAQA